MFMSKPYQELSATGSGSPVSPIALDDPFTILHNEPHVLTYEVDVGNPMVKMALRSGPSTTCPELKYVVDGQIITTSRRLRVRAADGTEAEWMRLTSPVDGYTLFTLQQKAVPHVNARAKLEGSVFTLAPYTILEDEPHMKTYKVDVGNPMIKMALRDGPSTTCPELAHVADGQTIATSHRLLVRAADGTEAWWMRLTSPVNGYTLFTLQQKAIPHVNARAKNEGSVFALVASNFHNSTATYRSGYPNSTAPYSSGDPNSAAQYTAAPFTILKVEPHAQTYKVDVGNPLLKMALRDGPSTTCPELTHVVEGQTIVSSQKLRLRAADGTEAWWIRITSPVNGYTLFTLQQKAIPHVNARAKREGSVFASVSTPYTILKDEPHVQTYKVDVGNSMIQMALRDGPSTTCPPVKYVADGQTITTPHKLRVRCDEDGTDAEWLRLTSPVHGYTLFTLQQKAVPHVNARALREGSVFALMSSNEAPYVLVQGPLPQHVYEASECPICLWEKPEWVKSREGATNRDQGGAVVIIMCTLQCGHQLCSGCCEIIAKSRPQCPSCRAKMTPAELRNFISTTSGPVVSYPQTSEWNVEQARSMVGTRWQRGEDGMNRLILRRQDGTETAANIYQNSDARIHVSPGTDIVVNGERVDTTQCAQQ